MAGADTRACATAQRNAVRCRDNRVEVRAGDRPEQQDQHGQAEHRGGGVLQELQSDVVGESCCAAIPDPTTTVTSRAVPVNSASSRRGSGTGWFTDARHKGVGAEQYRELLQRVRDDPVVDPGASALTVEKSGGAQDLQVMGDGRLGQVDPDRQFADTPRHRHGWRPR